MPRLDKILNQAKFPLHNAYVRGFQSCNHNSTRINTLIEFGSYKLHDYLCLLNIVYHGSSAQYVFVWRIDLTYLARTIASSRIIRFTLTASDLIFISTRRLPVLFIQYIIIKVYFLLRIRSKYHDIQL